MKDGKLGVAIHGAGWVAGAHAASWKKNPHATIVSISSRRKESARRLAGAAGLQCTIRERFEDVLRDDRVDIVNLSGPHHVHAEQGIAAAEAGKHILVEKPMALTTEENRALREAVARSGVKSIVSFVLRWNPLFESLRSLLAAGAIGKLFHVEADYWHGIGSRYTGWDWIRTKAVGRSAMLSAGCHAVDALRWFAREEASEVAALSGNARGRFEYDSNVVAIVRFRSGITGKTSAFFDCEMPYTFNVNLLGTEGTLRENRIWSKRLFPAQTGWATFPTVLPDSADVSHHPFDAEIDHFVDCIRTGRESHCNIADAYLTHELCLAIDRSIVEGGRPVKLPLDGEP